MTAARSSRRKGAAIFYVNRSHDVYSFDQWLDEDILPYYNRMIDSEYSKKLVILHTIGSHWWYNLHYTKKYEVYKPVLKSKIISYCTDEEIKNSYDNTILYTDYFLSNLINRLKDEKAILIYQSDHGEALGEDGIWLHAVESPFVHQAACMVWMSDKYKEAYPDNYTKAKENSVKKFRTDYLFHSILDAGGIGSEYINDSMSIFR